MSVLLAYSVPPELLSGAIGSRAFPLFLAHVPHFVPVEAFRSREGTVLMYWTEDVQVVEVEPVTWRGLSYVTAKRPRFA